MEGKHHLNYCTSYVKRQIKDNKKNATWRWQWAIPVMAKIPYSFAETPGGGLFPDSFWDMNFFLFWFLVQPRHSTDRQTESDAYQRTVQLAQVGSKIAHQIKGNMVFLFFSFNGGNDFLSPQNIIPNITYTPKNNILHQVVKFSVARDGANKIHMCQGTEGYEETNWVKLNKASGTEYYMHVGCLVFYCSFKRLTWKYRQKHA